MIEVFKMFNGLDDIKVEDFFDVDTATRQGHSRKLIKYARLNIRKYSFSIRIVDLWNKLSEDTVTSKIFDSFKKLLDRDMSRLGFI